MDVSKARVSISLSEGRLEFEGDESFVSAQLAKFEDAIKQAILSSQVDVKSSPKEPAAKAKPSTGGEKSISDYENLFAIADGKVQILKTLPGNSTAEKMASAAILLSFANFINGQESTTFDAIRALCKTHGCLDASNFAKVVKSQKSVFVFTGGSKSSALSLTVPGKKKAESIANSLNVP